MEVVGLLANHQLLIPLKELQYSTTHSTVHQEVSKPVKQLQVRLTPEQVDELVTWYKAGSSVRELVQVFSIHRTTVLDHLKRRGVPMRPAVRKLTDQQVVEATRHYRTGNSLDATARKFGVHSKTMKRELTKLDSTAK